MTALRDAACAQQHSVASPVRWRSSAAGSRAQRRPTARTRRSTTRSADSPRSGRTVAAMMTAGFVGFGIGLPAVRVVAAPQRRRTCVDRGSGDGARDARRRSHPARPFDDRRRLARDRRRPRLRHARRDAACSPPTVAAARPPRPRGSGCRRRRGLRRVTRAHDGSVAADRSVPTARPHRHRRLGRRIGAHDLPQPPPAARSGSVIDGAWSPDSATARENTASSIGGVRRPVKVFCWLGWNEQRSVDAGRRRRLDEVTELRSRPDAPLAHAVSYAKAPRQTTTRNRSSARELATQERPARVALGGQRLVVGRRALHR